MFFAGVDVGSLRTPNFIAWLDGDTLLFDLYIPCPAGPLPVGPSGWGPPAAVAFDAPQGLPRLGEKRRVADAEVRTPTQSLPRSRQELQIRKLYAGLVTAGIEIFWWALTGNFADVWGLPTRGLDTVIGETYPRYVLRRLAPGKTIPSKRQTPHEYIDMAWPVVQAQGCYSPSVIRPTVDQVDAALCAIAAREMMLGKTAKGTVGVGPTVDAAHRVLREGFIVAP